MSAGRSIYGRTRSPSRPFISTIPTWSETWIGRKTTRDCSSSIQMQSSHSHAASHGFCPACGTRLEARYQEDRDRPTCPSCGFVHYLDPKVAVAVILGDEDGVLL